MRIWAALCFLPPSHPRASGLSRSAAKPLGKNSRLWCLLPDLAERSPRMEIRERWVTGASPAWAARCPAVGNEEPSPTSSRNRAAVRTPTQGGEVMSFASIEVCAHQARALVPRLE